MESSVEKETSGLATASMVIGLLSIIIPFILTLPAIILGVAGLKDISDTPQAKGTGSAITGIITAVLGICFWMSPAMGRPGLAGERHKVVTQAHKIVLSCRAYSSDHNGALPTSLEELVPEYVTNESMLTYQFGSETFKFTYLTGLTDADGAKPVLYSKILRPGIRVVGFVDGHIEQVHEDHELTFSEPQNIQQGM